MSVKKKVIALVVGVAIFGAVSASAATLGGVSTGDIGANSNSVEAQISNGVNVSWLTAYDATLGAYKISGVVLSANGADVIPATSAVKLTLKDKNGAALAEISGTGTSLGAPAATVSASSVYGVSLVINGGTVTAAVSDTE
jgi:hypothetical protein